MTPVTQADLGGQPGHGPVQPEPEGDLFHASWEPRAMALTVAMGATGSWSIDASRRARETLPDYAGLPYYAVWLAGVERLTLQRGIVHADELAAGRALHPSPPPARVLHAADVATVLARGGPTSRPATQPARFAVGDRVRTRATVVPHHTRLPAYARGKVGVVQALHGVHVYPDANAQGHGEQPGWLYTVAFDEHALWGSGAAPQNLSVSVDAWDAYLEPA